MLKYNFDSKLEKTVENIKKHDFFINEKTIDLLNNLFQIAIEIDCKKQNSNKKIIMLDKILEIANNIKEEASKSIFLEKFLYNFYSENSIKEFYNNSEYSEKLSNIIVNSTPYLIYKFMNHFPDANKDEMLDSLLKIGNLNNLCLCAEECRVDLQKIEDVIIKSNNACAMLRFASVTTGANLDRLTNAVIKTNDEYYIYCFSEIKGVNVELIEEALIKLMSIKYVYYLAINCKSANLDKITKVMLNYRKSDVNNMGLPYANNMIYVCKYFCKIKPEMIDDVFGSKEGLLLLMYNLINENYDYNKQLLNIEIETIRKQIIEYSYEKNYKNYTKK